MMEETIAKAEQLAGHIKEYVNVKIESVKLDAAEKSSKIIANAIAMLIILFILFLAIGFASIAAAYAISDKIGKTYTGFLIVSGIYLAIGIIIYMMREKLIRIPVMNSIIQELFKHDKADEQD